MDNRLLSDAELLLKLRTTEDPFVERKSKNDLKDVLKSIVAFANSTPVNYPAVLFLGAKNDGTIETGLNLDNAQKEVNKALGKAYPAIYTMQKIVRNSDGAECLAVIIPGSPDRPHFSGPSYVRLGSESVAASKGQFNQMIAERQSKVREILRWLGKNILIEHYVEGLRGMQHTGTGGGKVIECNQFYVTIESGQPSSKVCYPLNRIEISFDPQRSTLKLEIRGH